MPHHVSPISSGLLTDLYELTMAHAFWLNKRHEHEAVFHLSFRRAPFNSGYAIAAGLEQAIHWLEELHFSESERDYLGTLRGNDGKPLFSRGFLDHLRDFRFECDVDAIPEGTVVFPQEPLIRVKGPILQAQIAETALLNLINFPTLVATKAARIWHASGGEPVAEFGLRRAQGVDGGLSASRAAFIGGCSSTSNVLAGHRYGIPVRGTHAHSWVMAFDSELESFEAYARAMPNNCVFLVDSYDTLEGVRHAITVGRQLREQGRKMIGIRLDSGDLAWLSIQARQMLDEAGFSDAVIMASNDLDEHTIESLKDQGATITVWGVGTQLATAYDQPALGGVYKLGAVRPSPDAPWKHRIKLSEQTAKITNPGIHQVRRFFHQGQALADLLYNEADEGKPEPLLIDPEAAFRRREIPRDATHEDLLVPVFRKGKRCYDSPPLVEIRERSLRQLDLFHPTIRRFLNPHEYPVGLEPRLYRLKRDLIYRQRGLDPEEPIAT